MHCQSENQKTTIPMTGLLILAMKKNYLGQQRSVCVYGCVIDLEDAIWV